MSDEKIQQPGDADERTEQLKNANAQESPKAKREARKKVTDQPEAVDGEQPQSGERINPAQYENDGSEELPAQYER